MPNEPKSYSVGGEVYDIPDAEVQSFLKDNPDATEVSSWTVGKDTFDIPVSDVDAFLKDNPQAQSIKKKISTTTAPLQNGGQPVSNNTPTTSTSDAEKQVPIGTATKIGEGKTVMYDGAKWRIYKDGKYTSNASDGEDFYNRNKGDASRWFQGKLTARGILDDVKDVNNYAENISESNSDILPTQPQTDAEKLQKVPLVGQSFTQQNLQNNQQTVTPTQSVTPENNGFQWSNPVTEPQSTDNIQNETLYKPSDTQHPLIQTLNDIVPIKGESYLGGTANQVLKGFGATMHTLDAVSQYISDATGGVLGHSGTFKELGDNLNASADATFKQIPDDVGGKILSGAAQLPALGMEMMMTPELKLAKLGQLTNGIITSVPKLGTVLGINAFADSYANSVGKNQVDRNLEAYKSLGIGTIEGSILHSLGFGAGKLGELVGDASKSPLLNATTSAVTNGLGFAGYDAAKQYEQTGKIDLKTVAGDFGFGLAMGFPQMAVIAGQKALKNFSTASPELLDKVAQIKKTPEQLRDDAIKNGEQVADATTDEQKNELLIKEKSLNNLADIKGVLNLIGTSPESIKKIIESDETLSPEEKQYYNDKVDKSFADIHTPEEAKQAIKDLEEVSQKMKSITDNKYLSDPIKAQKIKELADESKVLNDKIFTLSSENKTEPIELTPTKTEDVSAQPSEEVGVKVPTNPKEETATVTEAPKEEVAIEKNRKDELNKEQENWGQYILKNEGITSGKHPDSVEAKKNHQEKIDNINAKYDAELESLKPSKPEQKVEAGSVGGGGDVEFGTAFNMLPDVPLVEKKNIAVDNKKTLSSNPEFVKNFGNDLNNNQFDSAVDSILNLGEGAFSKEVIEQAYNYKWKKEPTSPIPDVPLVEKKVQETIDNANYKPRHKNGVVVRLPIDFVLDNQEQGFKVERGKNEIGSRIDKAKKFLESNPKDLEASDIYIKDSGKDKGKIGFGDGRHRLIAAKELGATHAYFELPATKEQFDALNYLLTEFGNEKGIDHTELYSIQGDYKLIQTSDNTFLLNNGNDIYTVKLNESGGFDDAEINKNGKKIKGEPNLLLAVQNHLQEINPESHARNINKFLGRDKNAPIPTLDKTSKKEQKQIDEAKKIIESAGLEVPKDLSETAPNPKSEQPIKEEKNKEQKVENKIEEKNIPKKKVEPIENVKVGEVNKEFQGKPKVEGEETTIEMPDGESRKAKFMVVSADDIIASHSENSFADSEGYPKENGQNVNPRNYKDDDVAKGDVMDNARNLKPSIVISDSATPDSGVPIISNDGIVLSGNGRTMSIKRAIKEFPEKYAEYKKQLLAKANKYGLDPNEVGKIKNPILVKVDENVKNYTTKELDKYNQSAQKGESPADKLIKQSNIINADKDLKQRIFDIVGRHDTMSEFHADRVSVKQMKDLLLANKVILEHELSKYFVNSEMTPEGKDLISDMLVAAILKPETIRATDIAGVKQFRRNIVNAIPALAKNFQMDNFSLENEINDAIKLQAKFKSDGHEDSEFWRYMKMGDVFDLPDPNVVALNRMIASGEKNFKKNIQRFNTAAETSKGGMFGAEQALTKPQLIEEINKLNLTDNEKEILKKIGDAYSDAKRAGQERVDKPLPKQEKVKPEQKIKVDVPKKQIKFERNDEQIKKIDDELDDLLGSFGKKATTGLDPEQAGKAVKVVSLLMQKGYYKFEDMMKFAVEKGLNDLIPYLKNAYQTVRDSFDLSPELKYSLDNDVEINKVGEVKKSLNKSIRPPIRIADEKNLPTPKKEHILEGSYNGQVNSVQRLGVNLALDRFDGGGKGFLLADGAGAGKTRTELAIANEMQDKTGKKSLIVTESQAIIDGSFVNQAKTIGLDLNKFEVGTYSELASGKIGKGDYGVVIYDEAHNLKNPLAQRSIAQSKVKSDHNLFATATPMDKIEQGIYFLSEITDKTPQEIQKELGVDIEYKKGRDGETYTVATTSLSPKHYESKLLALRDAAIEKGAIIRREFPFFGDFENHQLEMTPEQMKERNEIETVHQNRLDNAENIAIGKLVNQKLNPKKFGGDFGQFKADLANDLAFKGLFDKIKKDYEAGKGGYYNEAKAAIKEFEKAERFAMLQNLDKLNESAKADHIYKQVKKDLADGKQSIVVGNYVGEHNIRSGTKNSKYGYYERAIKKEEALLNNIAKRLDKEGIPYSKIFGGNQKGGYKIEQDKFQKGETKVMLMTTKSGGTGIDLDDTVGDSPRVMHIATSEYSGNKAEQLFGRVSRMNTKSPALIRSYYFDNVADNNRKSKSQEKQQVIRNIVAGKEDLDAGKIGTDIEQVDENAPQKEKFIPKEKSVKIIEQGADIIVQGDTFPIKDKLKELGARWDGNAKAWKLPKEKTDAVNKLLSENNLIQKEPTAPPEAPKEIVEPPKKEISEGAKKIQTLLEKAKAARDEAKAIRDKQNNNLGAIKDPFKEAKERAQADRKVIDAYVDLAKEYISQTADKALHTLKDFADAIGEKIDDFIETGWSEANKKEEPKLDEGSFTSIQNKVTEQKIKEYGLTEAAKVAKRDFGTVWDEAVDKIENQDYDPQVLIKELNSNPRPITDLEDATLLYEQNKKEIQLENITNDLLKATEKGDEAGIVEAKLQRAKVLDDLQDIYDAGKKAGTATARGLNARKMMVNRKYSLINMKQEIRAVNDGKPLTEAQEKEIEGLHQKIKDTQAAYDEYVKNAEGEIKNLQEKILGKKVVNKKSAAEKLRAFADKIDESTKGEVYSSVIPITPKMVSDAIRLIADGLEKGGEVLDLIKKAIDEIKGQFPDIDEAKLTKEINKSVIDSGIIESKPEAKKIKDLSDIITPEGLKLKAEKERAINDFEAKKLKEERKNRPFLHKAQDTFLKWMRAFKLSGISTLAKLTNAALTRLTTEPTEEIVGGGISKLLPTIAKKSAVEGGFNAKALAKGYTQTIMQGFKDASDTLKTGKSDIDVVFGKRGDLPPEALDFFGQLHAAIKAPIKRFAFERSLSKRMEKAISNGVDVSDPMVQTKIIMGAYKDAQRSIFMQDNFVSDSYRNFVNSLETSKTYPNGGKAAATFFQWMLPFVKVPTNIVGEIGQNVAGVPIGVGKILHTTFTKGLENLSPEEADMILRNLKKGSIGAGALLLGYFNPQAFGGYYQQGEKRNQEDLKAGQFRFFGMRLPAWLLESPIFQTMQLGATIRRVKDETVQGEPKGMTEGMWAGALGLAEHEPLIEQPIEISKIFNSPNERQYYFKELAKSNLIPVGVQNIASWTDSADSRRQPKTLTLGEHLKMGVPYLREQVPKKRTYSQQDLQDPTFKFYTGKGLALPYASPTSIPIKDYKNKVERKLSDYSEETITKYYDTQRKFMKEKLSAIKTNGYVYKDLFGNISLVKETGQDDKKQVKLSNLTKYELAQVLSEASKSATIKTKAQLFPK